MGDLAELLIRPACEGYPVEYLLARIRGRRALRAASAGPVLHAEFSWVYRQMNGEIRTAYAPLFLWFELRTIILCLRFHRGGDHRRSARLLDISLLTDEVRRVLTGEATASAIIDALAVRLAKVIEPYRTLGGIFREKGWRELEQRLDTLYLERMIALPLVPPLTEFFRGVIDLRNLVTLSKQVRWQLKEPQTFISGGEIPPRRLGKALDEGTPAALPPLLAALSGMGPVSSTQANPEPLLLGWLTKKVRKLARDPLGLGVILDYLWRCSIEARNLGLTRHGEHLEPAAVEAELIR